MYGLARLVWTRDAALAAVLAGVSLTALPDGRPRWVQVALLVVLAAALLWRRRRPLAAAAVVLGAAWLGLLGTVWREHLPLGHLAVEVVVCTLVQAGRRAAAAVVSAAGAGFFVAWAIRWYPGIDAYWGSAGFCLSLAVAWLLGEYLRARQARAAAERRALAATAAAGERARIARELHDVLAHSVGVMVVNAEGARLMRHVDPAVVDRTLELISTTGRGALEELRRLLAALDEHASTAADLEDLVRRNGAGLHVTGTADGVPPEILAQAYRIVQEALTNVVKHAGAGARADVRVGFGTPGRRRTLRIEVLDAGGTGGAAGLPSSGRGLAGMRERVALAGGTLTAEPVEAGGFRVVATLPVGSTAGSQPRTAGAQAAIGRIGL
ncbi:sensor histidine kinase [Dactylosporangium sucinum]|uniref:sensor histidine kinase n=1 Tax=Dactylosporangium sucinum TaxID=1424081 RepID=UPI00167CFBDB|nr:histidine kinase [Dactylosporangium sucinum]